MNAVIAFALRQRVLMVLLMLFVSGVGIASFFKLNIEAYPDPVPPLVDVVTQNPGQSAEEIERYITLSPLPNGATPQISPESPIGEIYRYRVVGPEASASPI
jgi:cobalt-zinc-cadmium resistance protein CzcA